MEFVSIFDRILSELQKIEAHLGALVEFATWYRDNELTRRAMSHPAYRADRSLGAFSPPDRSSPGATFPPGGQQEGSDL